MTGPELRLRMLAAMTTVAQELPNVDEATLRMLVRSMTETAKKANEEIGRRVAGRLSKIAP